MMLTLKEVAMQIPEEQQLLTRCRAGDLDAFGLVYARYERLVFRYAYHQTGHSEDARDITQETFLRAYQALPKFRGGCRLHTWLLKICRNLCLDRRRSWEHRQVIPMEDQVIQDRLTEGSLHLDPQRLVERAMTTETIYCALNGLPTAQRELIVLREIEDLSNAEIAEILGCTVGSVGVMLFRARRQLKERVLAMLREKETTV